MPLDMEAGLGPGDIVLVGDPAPPKRVHSSTHFGPCLSWPNGWMDQDASWFGGRPRPIGHTMLWGLSSSPKGHSNPLFSAPIYRGQTDAHLSYCSALVLNRGYMCNYCMQLFQYLGRAIAVNQYDCVTSYQKCRLTKNYC